MMDYVEFKVGVPIWDIGDEDGKYCTEIRAICDLIGITLPGKSLEDLYVSFYALSGARSHGDLSGRIGRGGVFVFVADSTDQTFLVVDTLHDATDQMDMVGLGLRCEEQHAEEVFQHLTTLRKRAEVASAFLKGNLGLKQAFDLRNVGTELDNHGEPVWQKIALYRGGVLQATSRRAL